jgi:hypothetical protein
MRLRGSEFGFIEMTDDSNPLQRASKVKKKSGLMTQFRDDGVAARAAERASLA